MKLTLQKTDDGIRVLDGQMRLKTALSLKDEVLVESTELGDVLIAKLPDGSIVATQDELTMALLGL